ncbi:MAG TPA: hypothetical protein VE196_09965 [Pseudonocardiaceae bacterium]|nr:hypothetical protein [Pseudonocardiaceae bacterium]
MCLHISRRIPPPGPVERRNFTPPAASAALAYPAQQARVPGELAARVAVVPVLEGLVVAGRAARVAVVPALEGLVVAGRAGLAAWVVSGSGVVSGRGQVRAGPDARGYPGYA